MAGRSLHRSQDMGRLQDLGPSPVRLALVEDRTGQGTDGLFAGIDTLTGASALPPPASAADPAALLALRARSAQAGASADELAHLDRAIAAATGVVCDARSDDDRVVAGQRVAVTLECWNTGSEPRTVTASLGGSKGFPSRIGRRRRCDSRLARWPRSKASRCVAGDAPLTAPYFQLRATGPELLRLERGATRRARRAVRPA